MKKILIFVFILAAALAIYFLAGVEKQATEEQQAINLALEAYEEAVAEGIDLENGPCIANYLMEDWVADIAHDPREEVDNDPLNQCSAYREGNASHFVEIDPEGNVIKVR